MAMPIGLRPVKFNEKDWPLKAVRKPKKELFPHGMPVGATSGATAATNGEDIHNGNIAAIDFGTTHCSLAYTTETGGTVSLMLNEVFPRVPTAILLKKTGDVVLPGDDQRNSAGVNVHVHAFGRSAQTQYQRIKSSDRCNYIYFERMKMRLQHDKNVSRSMKVQAYDSNAEWFLIEVIALILQYLKDELNGKLMKCEPGLDGNRLKATDFDWVITVPAIWQARGKGMMREAGNMAGLYNERKRITYLSYVHKGVQVSDENVSPRLSLVPEPEAAAMYCREMKTNDMADQCRQKVSGVRLDKVDRYIVVDAGGGTIDVTVQSQDIETGKIEIIENPIGNDCGGVMVNNEFAKLMQKILGETPTDTISNLDIAFSRLLSGDDSNVLKPALNYLLYKEFDEQKERFGSEFDCHMQNGDNELAVKLPEKIVKKCKLETIEKNVAKLKDKMIEIEDDTLYIKFTRVLDFFKPSLKGILDCTRKVILPLMESDSLTCTLFLVGGFGGCRFIYSHIEKMISESFPKFNLIIAVPEAHKMAVAHGAVLYKKKPLIRSRMMNRTYGMGLSVPFHSSIHDENHIRYNDDGNKICSGCFLTFIESGDPVYIDEVSTFDILPDMDSRVISIPFYCSEEPTLKYLYDCSTPGVLVPLAHKVGELQFILPSEDILHQDQRTFTVILDFSSVEIYAIVRYCNTGQDIHTKLDFLC